MNGPLENLLDSCIARANISFPTPVSPNNNTGRGVLAALRAFSILALIDALCPDIFSKASASMLIAGVLKGIFIRFEERLPIGSSILKPIIWD